LIIEDGAHPASAAPCHHRKHGLDRPIHGPAFAQSPIGEPFDPDALAERVAAGKPYNGLIFRSDQHEAAIA
jgi:hypothetical protein